MADNLNGLFISEILADNAGGAAIDTDGDGTINKSDEFIEIQNASGTPISLDGFEIWSEKNGLLFSFSVSDTIGSGNTATVVGNYGGTPPAGFYSAGISEGTNFIPDGEDAKFDTIFLVDTNTGEYVALSYGAPAVTPTLPSGFPGTTQVGAGETIDSSAPNGTAFTRDATGTLIESTPTPGTPDIPCFLRGTHIQTKRGEVRVEDLQPGDLIVTRDAGYIPLRGVGRFEPTPFELRPGHAFTPITFPAGTIGNTRDLSMSRSHRILIGNTMTELLFGQSEVLVAGGQCLENGPAYVSQTSTPPVYFHLLFDQHEIISAEGCWAESLFLADLGQRSLDASDVWHFAEGFDPSQITHNSTARMVLKQFEASVILDNNTPLAVADDLPVAA